MEVSDKLNDKLPGRSHGLKLIAVCFLVLVMSIPAMFISYISFERSNRADDVTREVSQRYGGMQYVTGPIFVTPYIRVNNRGEIEEAGEHLIFAESGHAEISDIETTIRKRSLFKVPTYRAKAELDAVFGPLKTEKYETTHTLLWEQSRIMVGVSDGRGLTEDIYLTLPSGKRLKFEPAAYNGKINIAAEYAYHNKFHRYDGVGSHTNMTFLSVPASDILSDSTSVKLKTNITLGGATKLGVFPYAKSTTVNISSDWPSPGFEGGFAPIEREISDSGFSAKWSVPYLARGVLDHGFAQNISLLNVSDKAMSVRFVSEFNPYQTVNRALKYSILFIGLVFIAYFLFEVLVGVRVHPAQYILIGIAQSIFYLLLLAFSERIGFGLSFLIAAGATVAITSGYAGAVFGDRKYILRAGIVFALTYGLLYVLMRMQDMALMIGALASFMAIALTMYLTRNMDWYGVTKKITPQANNR